MLLAFLSWLKKRNVIKSEFYQPHVSLIIAAYNEEKVIQRKIQESLALDYPKEKLEIIVASDASRDKTDEIVKSFSDDRIVLVRQDKRRGKTCAQNLAVTRARGSILVFSDATTVFANDAIRKLVRNFADCSVGCVGGEEHFLKQDGKLSQEAGFFWRYERLLRRYESKLSSLIGVSGCIFAIRKELYEPLDENIIEDFALPLLVAEKGYRTVAEEEAIAYEEPAADTNYELARKARIVAGGINVVIQMKRLLNPFKYPLLAFQLISHKIFRWLAPFFMLSFFISNMFLLTHSKTFFITGFTQIIVYFLALIGYFVKKHSHAPKVIRLLYHFCVMNGAAMLGIVRFLRGKRQVIWETIR